MLPAHGEIPGAVTGSCSPGADGLARDDSPGARTLAPAAEAQAICLRLLTARPRSRAELADALRKRGFPEEVGEPVLDRLSKVGLVDDAVFAESAVYSGHRYRGLGRRALRAELQRRGVSSEIADQAVAGVGPDDEEERARELVRRKLRTGTMRDVSTLARKLSGMLVRKGYSEVLAWRVVRDELGPAAWPVGVEPCPD
jgi:regulatory protein